MSTKIDELPPYVGTTNPIGDIPISINGVTYRITPQLAGQTLQQILDNNHDLVNGNNFQGSGAGDAATGNNINAFGESSVISNTGNSVNALGKQSAFSNSGNNINAMGENSAIANTGNDINAFGIDSANENEGSDINAIGTRAAKNNTGSHVNAFGKDAGNGNQLSGQTIFSNASFPSYANYAAAATTITVANGATAGCTYLFYEVDKQQLNAIRL